MIEIINLSHRFSDGTLGLDDINLCIKQGEFVVVGGLNGSGKTTLLKHLNGLLLPDTGMVRIAGVPVSKNLMRTRQIVGMVFQDADSQIVGETVYDDVAFGPENLCFNRDEIDRRVVDALSQVGLMDLAHQRPHVLSGGEKRRLAIAGILAMAPKVLVFDEPFSNLDYPGIQQVLEQIISLHASGHTILIATHDLEDVITCADRLVLMKNGKVVKDGRPANLIEGLARLGMREPRARAVRLAMEVQS